MVIEIRKWTRQRCLTTCPPSAYPRDGRRAQCLAPLLSCIWGTAPCCPGSTPPHVILSGSLGTLYYIIYHIILYIVIILWEPQIHCSSLHLLHGEGGGVHGEGAQPYEPVRVRGYGPCQVIIHHPRNIQRVLGFGLQIPRC